MGKSAAPLSLPREALARGAQVALFLTMAGIWGSSYFAITLGLRSFSPMAIVALRMGIATLILGLLMVVTRTALPRGARTYVRLAVLSVANVTIPFAMISEAERYVNATLASVLSSTTPLFVFLIASALLADEHFTVGRSVGIAIAFGSVVYLLSQSSEAAGLNSALAEAVIVGSSIIFAGGNVYSRATLGEVNPLVAALLQSAFAFASAVLLAVCFGHPMWRDLQVSSVLAVVWLGVAASALSYVLYFHFIRTWGSTRTSMNTYLQPVMGVLLGVLVLKNHLGSRVWASSGVTVLGVLYFGWATYRMQRGQSRASMVDRGRDAL